MFKNLTIKALILYITGVITVVNVVLFLLYYVVDHFTVFPYTPIVFIIITIIVNATFIRSMLDRLVFKKIKLIYKNITDSKLTKSEKKSMDMGSRSLEQVKSDVAQWTKSTQEEIKSLKLLENYRKDFVGNVSHELKTPLFSIQGYLHTLLDGAIYDENINLKYLKRAASNVDRLQTIVDDLEVINKLESDKSTLKSSVFELDALVKEIFEDLKMVADDKGISLKFKNDSEKGVRVSADREGIRQVLNNLIINSIKYGNEGGTTKVSFYNMDKKILVEVSDDGPGIAEKHLKHLFDRFYRIDNSRSRKVGGSGLGLSIVKHIIEAHKQSINVRSTIGVGSTFGFTLSKGI